MAKGEQLELCIVFFIVPVIGCEDVVLSFKGVLFSVVVMTSGTEGADIGSGLCAPLGSIIFAFSLCTVCFGGDTIGPLCWAGRGSVGAQSVCPSNQGKQCT